MTALGWFLLGFLLGQVSLVFLAVLLDSPGRET